MLIRDNPSGIYRPQFSIDRDGILIITRRFIFAKGRILERCWR